MDNIRSVLSIVLGKIPAREILTGKLHYDDITRDTFVKVSSYYVKNYSNDELENLFFYMVNEYEEQADYLRGYTKKNYHESPSFSIFDAILIFSASVLAERDGNPECQYEHLLRWRMTSHELDEDVFCTAYLAFKDLNGKNFNRKFIWNPVISHNNVYLKSILSQGMADNHFHLKGSAPQFPLSWISLMNNVTSSRFRRLLEDYAQKRLSTTYYIGEEEEHLYVSYLKAALIRIYLYVKITNRNFYVRFLHGNDKEYNDKVEQFVFNRLNSPSDIVDYRDIIQDNIMLCRHNRDNKTMLDYMLLEEGMYEDKHVNGILAGERWFMYKMYQFIYSKNEHFKRYFNYFYAYPVIKEKIRAELVQTNKNIGFDNFALYEKRKDDFIEGTAYEQHYIKMAIEGTLTNQRIRSLEVRIAPKYTAQEDCEYIRKFDKYVGENKGKRKELQKKFFYVFHFIKERDSAKILESDIYCRHKTKRDKLHKQARAIAVFRETYTKEAKRLRGIDACAKEIGCRPEVFSHTYRYLKNHKAGKSAEQIPQLNLTYHIGEDYLDVVDGLRAIEEAVRFLRLDCGSRMGHALALGINVEEYYSVKRNKILISQQDYLDNLVWIYYRIKKFELHNYNELLLAIEQQFNKYFWQIYGSNISNEGYLNPVMDRAKKFFREKNEAISIGYSSRQFKFGLPEYYSAWKLRGDNPECYINGYFREMEGDSAWNQYAVNREYPKEYNIRYTPECAFIYHLYHYSSQVKKEGAKVIEVEINYTMVQCIKEIQREMQKWIGRIGIGIECNPSSNYFIGTFERYDEHPIFKFYNYGLVTDPKLLDECPQLSVSINTDDQGVFSTYLENEYALLALALEKKKDIKGQCEYKRTMIYAWLDNIRRLGLNMSFANEEEDMYKAEEDKNSYK